MGGYKCSTKKKSSTGRENLQGHSFLLQIDLQTKQEATFMMNAGGEILSVSQVIFFELQAFRGRAFKRVRALAAATCLQEMPCLSTGVLGTDRTGKSFAKNHTRSIDLPFNLPNVQAFAVSKSSLPAPLQPCNAHFINLR